MFVAHVGIPEGIGELWRRLRGRQTVELRMWAEQAREIPADRDEQIAWLFGCWCRLDRWVGEHER